MQVKSNIRDVQLLRSVAIINLRKVVMIKKSKNDQEGSQLLGVIIIIKKVCNY